MNLRKMRFEPMSSEKWIEFISDKSFTSEELAWIYCCAMCWNLTDPKNLPAITKAMLDCGMDPNQLVNDDPAEENIEDIFFDNPMISATRFEDDAAGVESLKILLEHGGDPNTRNIFQTPIEPSQNGEYVYDGENIFDFYVEDEFANGPDLDGRTFYGLLLCTAYGGIQRSGFMPFHILADIPLSDFKKYERFWYEYEFGDRGTLFVIEKASGKRVAEYRW